MILSERNINFFQRIEATQQILIKTFSSVGLFLFVEGYLFVKGIIKNIYCYQLPDKFLNSI